MPTHDHSVAQQSVGFSLVAGALSGSANIASGFPFDVVKVRLQATRGAYSGPLHCAQTILRQEGFRAFYRGLSAPLVGGAAETAVNYAVYVTLQAKFKARDYTDKASSTVRNIRASHASHHDIIWGSAQDNPAFPSALAIPAAAGSAGFVLSFILSPFELIKCRMQLGASGMRRYTGPAQCVQQLIAEEGWRGLTRGTTGTLAREVPGNAIFFTVYESLRQNLPGRPPREASIGVLGVLKDSASAIFCGGIAGMVMWTCVLPVDTAKSRMQVATPGSRYDVSVWRNLKLLAAEGGVRKMYAGFTPTIIRAFPANAAQWLTWELALRAHDAVV